MTPPSPRVLRRSIAAALVLSALGLASPALADPTPVSPPVSASPTPTPTITATPQAVLDAQTRLTQLQAQTEAASNAYEAAQRDLAAAQTNLAAARRTEETAQVRLLAAQSALDHYASSTYQSGGASATTLSLYLSDQNPSDIAHEEGLLSAVGDSRSNTLREMASARAEAISASAAADQAQAAATAATANAQTQLLAAQSASAQAQALLSTLVTQEALKEQQAQEAAQASAVWAALQAQWSSAAATPGPPSSAATGVVISAAPTAVAKQVLTFAFQQIGKPYLWGGNGPDSFDCSGLTRAAYASAGVSLPRVASDQQASEPAVAASQMLPGDLVFFGNPAHHVGLYIGNGLMLDAPHTGAFVRIETIWSDFAGAARPAAPAAPAALAPVAPPAAITPTP